MFFGSNRNSVRRVSCSSLAARLLVVACVVAPGLAHAQASPGSEAEKLFVEGKAAFDQGKYEEALTAYRGAWKLSQTFDVAANLGQTEVELGHYVDAAEHLSFAIAHLPPSVAADLRKELGELYAQARGEVTVLRLQVSPEGARVLVDGEPVGTAPLAPELFVEPGPHVIEVRMADHESARQHIETRAGEQHEVELALAPSIQSAESPPAVVEDAGPAPVPGPSWVPVAVGGTLAAIGVGMGVGFAVAAEDRRTERNDRLVALGGTSPCGTGAPYPTECAAIEELDSDATTYADVSVAGFVTAGVAAVATVAYLLWPREPAQQQGVRVAPAVGRTGGSMVLWGAF